MKVSTCVNLAAEVEVDISSEDIRKALDEALRGPHSNAGVQAILSSLNRIGAFLRALSDEQIARLTFGQRSLIEKFLREQAERFKLPEGA